MERECGSLIEEFKIISIYIEQEIEACFSYWEPDIPPLTIIFASIGRTAFEYFEQITILNKKLFFELIEKGITSSNTQISNAVATGLLESLVNRAANCEKKWDEFNSSFLINSKNYVSSYLSM